MESIGTPALWIGFSVFLLALLALDLGVIHRRAQVVRVREALVWSAVWILLALVFNVGVYFWFGSERALEFLTGYVVEKSLSVDNLFVFSVLFSSFAVPAALQHRVLLWGIVGALAMRAILIIVGAALLQRFHWLAYVFGALLVLTGVRLLVQQGVEPHPERNPLFRLLRRIVPSVGDFRGGRFFVVEAGRRYATPLFLVLMAVEATDLVFAIDSIPAIFAITTDPFIVFTSNAFAMLGLRALYFALADMVWRFHHLKIGLALVLVFVGGKMLAAGVYPISIGISLGVTTVLIGGSLVASVLRPRAEPRGAVSPAADHPGAGEPVVLDSVVPSRR
jgi:tellurite resistance protein TerC